MEEPKDLESFRAWKNGPDGKATEANSSAIADSINQFMEERADNPNFGAREVFEKTQQQLNRGIIGGSDAAKRLDQHSEGFFSIYHQRRLGEQFKDFM